MKHNSIPKKNRIQRIPPTLRRLIVANSIKVTCALNLPILTTFFVGLGCTAVADFKGKSGPKLWMLGKDGLNEDLLVSLNEDKWAIPINMYRGLPKIIAKKYLPTEVDDNSYDAFGDLYLKEKNDYMETWRTIFRYLPDSKRPAAITTGNFGYYAERELASAASKESIPFIAMHKECLKSDGRLAFFKEIYERRGQFTGSKILVYNERERKLQIDSKVATEGQVIVCGMPRLDRLHKWRINEGRRVNDSITLLAMGFTEKTGLPRVPRKGDKGGQARFEYLEPEHEHMGWHKYFYKYHETLIKIARDDPSIIVKLKLKSRYRDAEPSIKLVKKLNAPDNFKIVVGGDPFELIINSNVVCGFNTTAILEGLAAGLPVVTPEFDEVIDSKMRDFAPSFGEATYRPNDQESMYNVIVGLLKSKTQPVKELTNDVKDALDIWVGNSDGNAGNRVRQVFEKEMKIRQ